jgi:hypothetical protein
MANTGAVVAFQKRIVAGEANRCGGRDGGVNMHPFAFFT